MTNEDWAAAERRVRMLHAEAVGRAAEKEREAHRAMVERDAATLAQRQTKETQSQGRIRC